ncbi:hypothetical protein BDL97_09G069100 [Sphagnum fallax]|nr:hypothetical protein BDL97_09G069100 [Sphagnum fallax]
MAYWEVTQKLLQTETCIVRKPRLTETLLKKPPFRFLHDVISEACRQTGFAKGLFSPEELLSTNIKDKESKVKYLWKIINCVGLTLNASVPARPLKIVAGLEAEQTNVFLQASVMLQFLSLSCFCVIGGCLNKTKSRHKSFEY